LFFAEALPPPIFLWYYKSKNIFLDKIRKGSIKVKYINKKAAMFGLDARIALAIFAALSVITGATLFKVMEQVKAKAMLTEMQNVGKAWEQYLLDTGSDLPVMATDPNLLHRETVELIDDTVLGWKGPYLSSPYKKDTSEPTLFLEHPKYGRTTAPAVSKLPWGYGHTDFAWTHADVKCNDTTILCYTAVQFSSKGPYSEKVLIDKMVDGGDGAYSGNFRWYEWLGNETIVLIYAPHKKPA